jgi:hypothetical protein
MSARISSASKTNGRGLLDRQPVACSNLPSHYLVQETEEGYRQLLTTDVYSTHYSPVERPKDSDWEYDDELVLEETPNMFSEEQIEESATAYSLPSHLPTMQEQELVPDIAGGKYSSCKTAFMYELEGEAQEAEWFGLSTVSSPNYRRLKNWTPKGMMVNTQTKIWNKEYTEELY